MITKVPYRALLLPLAAIAGLSLAGCSIIGGEEGSASSNEHLVLSESSENPEGFELGAEEATADSIAQELVSLREADQAARLAAIESGRNNANGKPSPELVSAVYEQDAQNTERLKEIIAAHGWPTAANFGDEAADAAWLLAWHANQDREFQARVLTLLVPLVQNGEVEGRKYAYLADRVLVAQDKPQRYGTQFTALTIDGVVHFGPSTPVQEPESLDARRQKMGLMPFTDYARQLREKKGIPEDAPALPQ